jgi:hypothetical protein
MLGEGYEPEDGNAGWSDWHWFKVRGGRLLRLVVLSEKPVHYKGHFVKGRMQPCFGADCQLCAEGVGFQLRYVFAVVDISERRTGLIELSRSVALQIRDWEPRNEGLRGMELVLTKESFAKQSRMVVDYGTGCEVPWWRGLDVPDVAAALRSTWVKAGFECRDVISTSARVSPIEETLSDKGNGKKRFTPPIGVKR